MDLSRNSPSPTKTYETEMPTLHRQDMSLQNGQNFFESPNHRLAKMNKSNNHADAKRAVVSPLPRSLSRLENIDDHHPLMQQPVAPSITPAEMERQYFQNIAAAAAARASTAATVTGNTGHEQIQKDDYSDEDDVPSDIESCANESELQEELEKPGGQTPISLPSKSGEQDQTKSKEKHGSEKMEEAGDDEEDGTGYIEGNGSSTGAVKLKALETTNVAVAQVVENNNNEVREQLPNLQQVLFTLHQQQMFQLQVLQQIQQQVTKIAHHDGDMNGLKGDATTAAAMFSMMARGLQPPMPSSGSDDSCGADDISEGSLGSPEGNMAEHSEGKDAFLGSSFSTIPSGPLFTRSFFWICCNVQCCAASVALLPLLYFSILKYKLYVCALSVVFYFRQQQ